MKIKLISIAAIAGLALAFNPFVIDSTSYAGGHDKSKDKAQKRSAHAIERITLTTEQQAAMQAIKDRYQPQMDALHSSKQALLERRQALDPNTADYAEQAQVLDSQIEQLQAEKKVLKDLMREEKLQLLTPEQSKALQSQEKPESMQEQSTE